MKRHQTSAVGSETGRAGGSGGAVASRTHTALKANARTRSGAGEPRLVLASSSVWTHTVVLTGELDHRSAHALEAEIERLCEEGVTGIRLDLRELVYIDSIGVAVIVFRCGHCARRGFEFTLIPGPPLVQSAFERAGVVDSLPFHGADGADAPSAPLAPAEVQEIVARTGQTT
jgi:anti-anti-sigma factor